MKYTLAFDSPLSDLSSTGGKGHNLAQLTRDGNFPVPPGFTITVNAYHVFVTDNNILKDIEMILAEAGGTKTGDTPVSNTADLERLSEKIRASFRRCHVSSELKSEIESQLEKTIPDVDVNLAVRSSATCEDMPDASFAGQHDTYLNVSRKDIDNICSHVVDCFSSLFTSRAISYRERNGLSHVDAAMAVVVQALVPSDSSGVLFTANPLTGRRQESVLEAIPGLGEALVSGLTEPDRYVVSRQPDGSVKIKDARVGAKMTAIRPVDGGGVKEEKKTSANTASSGDEASTVLTEEEVYDLIELGQQIETHFGGNPQDIEFARSKGKTYIVQSRPITTLFPLPNLPADPLKALFSFGAVQGVGSPFFPAGTGSIKYLLGGLIRWISWGHAGKDPDRIFHVVAERLYIDITPILENSVGRKIFLKALQAIEPGILAGLNEVVNNGPCLGIKSGMSPSVLLCVLALAFVLIPKIIFTIMFPNYSRKTAVRILDKKVQAIVKEVESADSLLDLVNMKERTLSGAFPNIVPLLLPRVAVGIGPQAILAKLASSVPNGKDLCLTITRGMPHNCTTEMDLRLWEVAKAIRADDAALECLRNKDADSLAEDYLAGNLPETAQNAIHEFLTSYGMRGLYEIDFGRPRWREEPAPLMQTFKSYVEIDDEHAPDKVFGKGEKAAEAAIEQLGKETGKPLLVSFLARRIRAVAGIRELPKFTIIKIMGIIRQQMIKEGKKLVKAGTLDEAVDVFLLHDDELRSLARGDEPARDWKALVNERKGNMVLESERTRIPRVIASDGFAFFGGAAAANVAEGANVLVGEPVSPGVYEGVIRIVHDPSKSTLKPGEILCCHGTDPSWTPLFLSAGALVMECGGLMAHGSVVAREYGIPAVVGLEKVTERLKNSQRVRVDGSSGVVTILDNDDGKEEKKDD